MWAALMPNNVVNYFLKGVSAHKSALFFLNMYVGLTYNLLENWELKKALFFM